MWPEANILPHIFIVGYLCLTNGQSLQIIPSELNVAKFEGEDYFVSCQSDETFPVKWKNPKKEVIGTSESSRIRTETNIGLELYFNNIKVEDAGVYTCISKGQQGHFNLAVISPIRFDTTLATQTARERQDYLMKCVAHGSTQNLKINWRIDSRVPSGRFEQLTDGNLRISNVTESDSARKFLCRAVDINPIRPDVRDMVVTLKVQMKPKVEGRSWKTVYGVAGELAKLTCQVTAEPPTRFEWYSGHRRLSNTNNLVIINEIENQSTLTTHIRRSVDFGDYICRAINQFGSVDQTINLKRANKPRTPTLSIVHMGSTGVAVRVDNPRGPATTVDAADYSDNGPRAEELPVIGYSVQSRMLTREDWITDHDVTLTNYGFDLRNLNPGVTYIIRAAFRNLAATGDYSAQLELTTPNYMPFTPPLNTAKK